MKPMDNWTHSAATKAYYIRPNGDYNKWEVEVNGESAVQALCSLKSTLEHEQADWGMRVYVRDLKTNEVAEYSEGEALEIIEAEERRAKLETARGEPAP